MKLIAMHRSALFLLLALATTTLAIGCQSVSWPALGGIQKENTSYRTAAMRTDAIRDMASQATGVDTPEQREIANQLARQIQVEPDPLVREAIVETIAKFRTPLASQVLVAGLQDADTTVRRKCCKALGSRGEVSAIPVLQRILESDENIDVRLAAVRALGGIESPQAVAALAVALDDRDPAIQFAGVQSMKSVSDQDFGGDVASWLQYAQQIAPISSPSALGESSEVSIAGRPPETAPY